MHTNSIGEASRQSGVTIETIRYYEREGIVPSAERGTNGRRRYRKEDIVRLRFVKRSRNLGLSIPDIRTLLQLSSVTAASCREAKSIGESHLATVRTKIADLTRLEAMLVDMVAQCETGDADCPMIGRLFAD